MGSLKEELRKVNADLPRPRESEGMRFVKIEQVSHEVFTEADELFRKALRETSVTPPSRDSNSER
ncbi:MAG TPA: hypothetical protein VHO06_21800 [Polyangia bacterium]|nr:hypothetical protein [Polyangia bacterium]